jgi:dTMP kinase
VENKKGILIAIEGIDGAGKTTQVNLIANALRDIGETVVTSKEPTDGKWGKLIRESAQKGRLPVDLELEYLINDRIEHVRTLITPTLNDGNIVVLDRYFYSTIAYQGIRGINTIELIKKMHQIAPIPDVVFLIDTDPKLAIERIANNRGDIPNEFETFENLSEVRKVFIEISNTEPEIVLVNGALSISDINNSIMNHLYLNSYKAKRCSKIYGCHDFINCSDRLNDQCTWYKNKALYNSNFSNNAIES